MPIQTIKWKNNSIRIIDQRKLPLEYKVMTCRNIKDVCRAIKTLSVRGAPAIGVAAAFGVFLGVKDLNAKSRREFEKKFSKVCDYIGSSRPTAVNLFNALERMKKVLALHPQVDTEQLKKLLLKEAFAIFNEDKISCRKMGDFGARLIKNNSRLLTICNAGALATVDYGTALGVMYSAKKAGKKFSVYACETRPLLQGARLTAWELTKAKIPTTLICDNMAATVIKQKRIDAIFTGADRIAANGDTANKIGTYNLAILAKYHKVPFYVVAPFSTFDLSIASGRQIPIEERHEDEVTHIAGRRVAAFGVKVFNPAFDVTDHNLITAIITERGIIRPSFKKNIKKLS
ncbi:MAG: S-methyl-5-thioribose-1-phosphate isomerase [Candidatus Omnitrophota bacterium]